MSRTDELRGHGARDRTGGGGGAPFLKWGDSYEWVEGHVRNVWDSKYGPSVTLEVTNASPGVQVKGKDEDGREVRGTVKVGQEINVGLNHAALEGAIKKDDVGAHMHVAFEGWDESKSSGNQYRVFTVLEIAPADERAKPGENVPTSEEVKAGTGMSREDEPEPSDDSGLPF